ncbi:hypothetical protein CN909_10105 [Bacillus cereus]|nr:hypothetical protein CN909_10105 [Bacillus cereus]
MINQKITHIHKTVRKIHNTLHILLILAHIISSIRLLAGQHIFLPLSPFLLGAFIFLITLEQIKKKDSRIGFI